MTALGLANVNPELSVAEWRPEILSKERPTALCDSDSRLLGGISTSSG